MIQDSFLWLRNIIMSSTHEWHLECCHKLLELFLKQYKTEPDCLLMIEDLQTALRDKETSITVFN